MPLKTNRPPARLALEDGTVFEGHSFAGSGLACGEIVFNTSMTGYQEVLTDPSYTGQVLMMTCPMIGNYGVNPRDMESASIHPEAFVVREYHDFTSNWSATSTLADFLEAHGRIGIDHVDTRALTRHIRTKGAMKAIVSTGDEDTGSLVDMARASRGLVGVDLVSSVSTRETFLWRDSRISPFVAGTRKKSKRVVVFDCGVKYNILRSLEASGCEVVVVPVTTGASSIMALDPDGVLISNGPGDPAPLGHAVETIRHILGSVPVFGICMGHQLLAQALGAETRKLKFGHHGVNQPVKDLETGKVEITSQNHGFVVLEDTLPDTAILTHVNLNDRTLEGFSCPEARAFAVQYHPEASPGPSDSGHLFGRFVRMLEDRVGGL